MMDKRISTRHGAFMRLPFIYVGNSAQAFIVATRGASSPG
jgi:hypothetical protein